MKVVTSAGMKQLEAGAEKLGTPQSQLMDNAGKAVADFAASLLGGTHGKKVIILTGPGNNGGDGEVVARYLQERGAEVALYIVSSRPADDANLALAQAIGVTVIESAADEDQSILHDKLVSADIALDAVFGTGNSRSIGGAVQRALFHLSEVKNARPELKIIAIDLPSGLHADSGTFDPATPFADYTVTLGLPKRGLYSQAGAERSGKVTVADIGIPAQLLDGIKTETLTAEWARPLLPRRSPYSHKGTFGKVMVIAGSQQYVGAAHWACTSAARTGAGLVTLAIPKGLQALVAPSLPEATYLPLAEATAGLVYPGAFQTVLNSAYEYNVVLIGPGLGASEKTKEFALKTLFRLPDNKKLVIDADALNYLATVPEWWKRIPYDAVLTPHPGEMATLCGTHPGEVQANRFEIALSRAAEWNKTIVLKGANTIIAAPDGRLRISTSANAGMATAGTGDVLAGTIAGLLAQGMSPFEGASLGVYLHAQAGEAVRERLGDAGMLASDLPGELPLVIKELKETNTKHQIPNTK